MPTRARHAEHKSSGTDRTATVPVRYSENTSKHHRRPEIPILESCWSLETGAVGARVAWFPLASSVIVYQSWQDKMEMLGHCEGWRRGLLPTSRLEITIDQVISPHASLPKMHWLSWIPGKRDFPHPGRFVGIRLWDVSRTLWFSKSLLKIRTQGTLPWLEEGKGSFNFFSPGYKYWSICRLGAGHCFLKAPETVEAQGWLRCTQGLTCCERRQVSRRKAHRPHE